MGWSQNQAATAPEFSDGQSVTNPTSAPGVLTFYAVERQRYNVTFDANTERREEPAEHVRPVCCADGEHLHGAAICRLGPPPAPVVYSDGGTP